MASTESTFTNATPAEDVVVSGVSDGPTVVAVPTQDPTHVNPAGVHIVKGSPTRGAGYFEELLAASQVQKGTKGGEVVHDSPIGVMEGLAWKESESVWIFDDAKEIGFRGRISAWSEKEEEGDEGTPKVNLVQTRAGAGSALAGYLSSDTVISNSKPTTVFATSTTLPLLLPVLSNLSKSCSKVIIHIATTSISSDPESLAFQDDFAGVISHLASIPEDVFDIVLSSNKDGIVATSASAYSLESRKSVIHVFESTFAGREIGNITYPNVSSANPTSDFEITGSSTSSNEIILVPSSHLANLLASTTSITDKAMVIALNSWNAEYSAELAEVVSASCKDERKTVYLVTENDSASRTWREVVTGALYSPLGTAGSSKNVKVLPVFKSLVVPSIQGAVQYLSEQIPSLGGTSSDPTIIANSKTISFYTNPEHPLPHLLSDLFLASPTLDSRLVSFGSSTAQGVKSVLSLRPASLAAKEGNRNQPIPVDVKADVMWVTEPQMMNQVDLISGLKDNGLLVLLFPWDEEEVQSKLSRTEREMIKSKKIRVFLMPPTSNPVSEQCAFLMLYISTKKLPDAVKKVLDLYYHGNLGREAVEEAQAGLTEVAGIEGWNTELEPEDKDKEEKVKPEWEWDALAGKEGVVEAGSDGMPELGDWTLAAKHLLFREAFEYDQDVEDEEKDVVQAITALRPSLEDKTYLVTVTENRRLTPETYDRNVFHIAFDTSNTGLTYAVGEALGIHGWNDAQETQDFIEWYGLDADQLVSYPSPHDGGKTFETRTVYQLMHQNLDIFGKPSKSFYASLALLAKDRADERTLRFIAAPEGVALFKKLSEKETVTFADVLKQFKSARPSFEELIGLIPEIKPRHYSIASSQKFSGDLVELLVVTVDWTTPGGSPRYGQCTRYLAGLKVGAKVTVSIKPSVMKLPPLDTQPVIMAGLGTGAAPFRAFIQHRAWQKSQGIEVGPLIYYFGSRYRSQEYLYGEEIEAYMASGIISHAGLAFSRDGKEKSYIQHKMTQDKALLSKMLLAQGKDAAYFYLCGPTWPVPDVFEALVSSLQEEGGKERKEAEAYIEELKEAERYVLEVY